MPIESRVIAAGPMPPEKAAYTLARYSRSPDSFIESMNWVKDRDADKFLETYYFQYGHASIADLGHVTLSLEGISELAALEVVDEQLWDGQQKSTRYQDFSNSGFVIPPGLNSQEQQGYCETAQWLLRAYSKVSTLVRDHLAKQHPKPADMKQDAYDRAIAARAFDNARYLLFLGVPTNVGQVTSIRTLERQIQRLSESRYPELQDLAKKMLLAVQNQPQASYYFSTPEEAIAPTLAKYCQPTGERENLRLDLKAWFDNTRNPYDFQSTEPCDGSGVAFFQQPCYPEVSIVASMLYPYTTFSYKRMRNWAGSLYRHTLDEVISLAFKARGTHGELPRAFRQQMYTFDIVTDIGAYRDLHRHRRCQQLRQPFTLDLGYETPPLIWQIPEALSIYSTAMSEAIEMYRLLWPNPEADYILPFATRCRSLFQMDFAEVEYICKLRTGVKGHFSYRKTAHDIWKAFNKAEPALGKYIQVTDPEVEEPLTR